MANQKIEPISAWLNVNRACQFRCAWCYAKGTEYSNTNTMNLQLAKALALMLAQVGVSSITLLGGEPTFWKHLCEFNDYCYEINIKTFLGTNAARFSEDMFWETYCNHPCTGAGISIKAGNYIQLTEVAAVQMDTFFSVKKGIKRYVDKFGKTYASITFNSFYLDNIVELAEFAIACGCGGVKIDFCHPPILNGSGVETYVVPHRAVAENIQNNYDQLNKITKGNILLEMSIPFCFWSEEFIKKIKARNQIMSGCQLQRRNGIIFDVTGNVLMCNCLFDFPVGKFGHEFHDGASLLTFLNSSNIYRLYERINAYPSDKCQKCKYWAECAGGCPINWVSADSNEVKPFE